MKLFVTGTDTHVGKTYVTAALIRAARAAGRDCVGGKPFCCGERDDAEQLWAASGQVLTLHDVNPIWLRPPAAPYTAAIIEGRIFDPATALAAMRALAAGHADVVVEGAGGWEVPLTREYFISDFAVDLGWPVLVVAANRLGALNHTVLTVRAIQQRGLTCVGVVLSEVTPPSPAESAATTTNHSILETLVPIPCWAAAYEDVSVASRVLDQLH